MPIRAIDPFKDPTTNLNPKVNPYMSLMRENQSLPMAYGSALRDISQDLKGTFQKSMGQSPERIVVEVGCHKGETLINLGAANPNWAFIGLDITFKRVVETARRAEKAKLDNVLSILANGASLTSIFAPQSVDGLIVFFPDPWGRKKSQLKKRLLNPEFVEGIHTILKPGGFFWFKTDHYGYDHDVVRIVQPSGLIEGSGPFPEPLGRDFHSRFEVEFHKRHVPTISRVWIRDGKES